MRVRCSPGSRSAPESVREVIDLRLASLGDVCVRLLTVAAVIGTEFELPLARISDLEGEDLAAALDAALVLELPDSDREWFAFSHALVRPTLLERLSRAHRRRIHARVAEALQTCQGEAALPQIAHHLCEVMPTVNREHALDYATRAAEQDDESRAFGDEEAPEHNDSDPRSTIWATVTSWLDRCMSDSTTHHRPLWTSCGPAR